MSDGYICIIPGPDRVLKTEDAGAKWCFAQRKRLPHTWELIGYPPPNPDDPNDPDWGAYYEPIWLCLCSGCGKDRTHFGDGW